MKKIIFTAISFLLCFSVSFASPVSKEILCPVCNIYFESIQPEVEENSFKKAIDGRLIEHVYLPLPECPLCKAIITNTIFTITELNRLSAYLLSVEYKNNLNRSTYYREALILKHLNRNPLEIANAYLRAYWASPDNSEQDALKESLNYFKLYMNSNKVSETHRLNVKTTIGDITRQLKSFSQAKEWFVAMATEKELKGSRLQRIINYELELIEQNNHMPAILPIGNPLHTAIINSDLNAATALFANNEYLNEINYNGYTPLMLSLHNNSHKITNALLDQEPDLTLVDDEGNTCTHIAVETKNFTVLKRLIKKGSPLNSKNNLGYTPLHLSIISLCPPAFLELLKLGADYSIRDLNGNNLYHLIAQGKEPERKLILSLLIKLAVDINQRNFNRLAPLHIAVKSSSEEIIKTLVANGAKADMRIHDGSTALFFCRPEFIPLLIELGADINLTNGLGQNAFINARLSNNYERLRFFAKTNIFGVPPKIYETTTGRHTIFDSISSSDSAQLFEILSIDKAAINSTEHILGETPLHQAVLSSNVEGVEILIGMGAKIDATNHFMRTPLHYAAFSGNIELIQLLIEAGASIYSTDARTSTPLHEAATSGNKLAYDYLSNMGAAETTKNDDGYSPKDLLLLSTQDSNTLK